MAARPPVEAAIEAVKQADGAGGSPDWPRYRRSMVNGMAKTQKVTITLPIQSVAAIRELVTEGKADTVSGFVQHAVQSALDDVTDWSVMLDKALEETGGPMTTEERAWADEVLGRGTRRGAA